VTGRDWEDLAHQLAGRSAAAGDPTGWSDQLYAAGVAGSVSMPWSREAPSPLLAEWARTREPPGAGRRAIVVGCGLGADAEYVAGLGYDTVAFDVAETAIQVARKRYPDSSVEYMVADLLDPPAEWLRAFDLVVEVVTVQALREPARHTAIVNVGRLVAPGGTLIVVSARWQEADAVDDGPPWPLRRDEIDAFATDGLRPVRVEAIDPEPPVWARWLAEFRRA
jgi:SAM-dependent methyltransferase